MPKDPKDFETLGLGSAIGTVLDGILKAADEARRNSDGYKNLFALYKDGGLAKAIFQAEEDMHKIVMDLGSVIKGSTGKSPDNELYDVMLALPLVFRLVRKDINDKEGMSCCADKMRDLIKNYFYRKLEMDVPVVSSEERIKNREKNGGIDG
ncbi:MAG: hypothetical protein ACYCT9_12225 [Leptospirillum sp.]